LTAVVRTELSDIRLEFRRRVARVHAPTAHQRV